MPPTARSSLIKNDPVFRLVLDWINGNPPQRLAGYSWSQDRWHSAPSQNGDPARPSCCVATASVLADGGHVIPPSSQGLLRWSDTCAYLREDDTPRPVADVARRVLGLTPAEATIVFSTRRTASQLLSLAPLFRDNTPITPASITLTTADELTLTWTDWMRPTVTGDGH